MVEEKLSKFSADVREMYSQLKTIVYTANPNAQEKLWAGLPSYYVGNAFVRLIPFKDHINVEAATLANHAEQLSQYKFTPKGMLQINVGQQIPTEVLTNVFSETLNSNNI